MKRDYITDDNGCWIWTGACDGTRPVTTQNGKKRSAARVFYEELHDCRVDRRANVTRKADCHPKCVNPAHGVLKTNYQMNEAFMDTYGAQRRRRGRETIQKKIERLEADRKAFRPIMKKR